MKLWMNNYKSSLESNIPGWVTFKGTTYNILNTICWPNTIHPAICFGRGSRWVFSPGCCCTARSATSSCPCRPGPPGNGPWNPSVRGATCTFSFRGGFCWRICRVSQTSSTNNRTGPVPPPIVSAPFDKNPLIRKFIVKLSTSKLFV